MSTIQDWLHRLKSKQTPASSWHDQRRNEALRLLEQVGNDVTWVDLSRHYDGFIREIAVRELCKQPSPEALKALIERQNDWVAQVRELAVDGVAHYLSLSDAKALLFALEPLLALAAQRRADHGPTLLRVRTVLQAPDNQAQVYSHFLTRQGKAARYLFALLLENNPAPQALLRSALAHRELTVRLLAVAACQALPTEVARPLLLEALSQPGAKVRVCVLRALLPRLDDPRPVLRAALLDASPSIRNLARWMAPRNDIDAQAVLAHRLLQPLPTARREWLGVLGLAAELDVALPQHWQNQALHCACSSVRQAAVRQLGDEQTIELLEALDDPADSVFHAAVARLDTQAWGSIKSGLDAKSIRDWHHLPTARREALLRLRPAWQQLAFLLERLDQEPEVMAFWLRQLDLWCHRQYQVVDPVTPKADRAVLIERLQALTVRGLVGRANVNRVV